MNLFSGQMKELKEDNGMNFISVMLGGVGKIEPDKEGVIRIKVRSDHCISMADGFLLAGFWRGSCNLRRDRARGIRENQWRPTLCFIPASPGTYHIQTSRVS